MKKRPMMLLGVGAVIARLLAATQPDIIIIAIGLLVLTISLGVKTFTDRAFIRMLLPVFLFAFYMIFLVRTGDIDRMVSQCEAIGEGEVSVSAKVRDIVEKNSTYYVYVTEAVCSDKKLGGCIVICKNVPKDITIGAVVQIFGTPVQMKKATNPGCFDEKEYYMAKGYYLKISGEILTVKQNNGIGHRLWLLREEIKRIIHVISEYADEGVFCAVLVGDKTGLSEELKDLYSESGISHILAISGLHVSFVGYLMFWLLRKLRMNYKFSAVFCTTLMLSYAFIAGEGVSVVRASQMFIISLIAAVYGRSYDMLSAMAFSWISVLVIWPYQINQAGFILSFTAILATGTSLGIIKKMFPKKRKEKTVIKIFQKLRDAYILTVSISLCTFPVLAWFYYRVAVISVVLNLLVIPLMSILLGSLLIGIMVYFLLGGFSFGLALSKICIMPAHYILIINRTLCEMAKKVPCSNIVTGRPLWWQLLIYYIMLALICFAINIITYKISEKRFEKKKRKYANVNKAGEYIKEGIMLPLITCAVLTALLSAGVLLCKRYKSDLPFAVFMDVGQGDGIYLQSKNISILIDGGSTSREDVSDIIKNVLLYYGNDKIDAWFITHPDTDHICGTLGILNDIDISNIYYPAAVPEEDILSVREKTGNINIQAIAENDSFSGGGIVAKCLYPRSDEAAQDENDLSLVLKVQIGNAGILFTGDMTKEAEARVLERYDNELRSDILKVAHHGSRYSTTEEFLRFVSPQLAVISCGINNYGHPSAEVLERLKGIDTHITLNDGARIIIFEKM